MKNKKGFTLVELIAIVVIVSIISVISFTALTKNIKKNNDDSINIFKQNIYDAAALYISSKGLSDFDKNGSLYIDTTDLIENEYLDSNIENKTDKDIFSYTVIAKKNKDNEIIYDLVGRTGYDILANGTSYFDTNIEGSGDIKIEAEASFSKDSGSNSYALYGARDAWKVNAFTFLPIYDGWFNIRPSYGKSEELKSLTEAEGTQINNKFVKVIQDKNSFKMDAVSYSINVGRSETSFKTKSIYIFGINNNGYPVLILPKGNKLRAFKIYKNNNIVRDFIPVIKGSTRYSNNPAPSNCLFDKVSNTYFEPIGGDVEVTECD